MKSKYFLALCLMVFSGLSAQQQRPFKAVGEQRNINGYTVRVVQAMHGGYGYFILQDNKPVVEQIRNPLPYSPKGIQKEEDAFKIAEWLILDYQAHGLWRHLVPPHVARELKIETR
jgi:hypothetical protein